MHVNATVDRWYSHVENYHKWRLNTSLMNKTILATMFAMLTALGAFMRFYAPWSPVPYTAQTYFVLLAGIALGRYWGAASQMIYIFVGLAGVPWFAGGNAGWETVSGVTGGYLIGFVLVAFVIGHLADTRRFSTDWTALFSLSMIGSVVILTTGSLGLIALGFTPYQAFVFGFAPFILIELVKAGIVGFTAGVVRPVLS